MTRTPFSFLNTSGLRVKGVVFESARGAFPETGVIYLPGIVLGMTAVHRLGVDIAEALQAQGFPVLIFSPSRVGESEGDLFAGHGEAFGNFIKNGGFVDDAVETIEAFCSQRRLERVILIGHCGGALTAIYAAQECRRVTGTILISPPLTGEIVEEQGLTRGQSREMMAIYKYRLFSRDAWKRLLSGKSDYRQIFRMIKRKLSDQNKGVFREGQNINWRLIHALESAGRRISVTILYGDRDPGIEEFRGYQDIFRGWKIRSVVFPETSHGFVTAESMRMLMDELKSSVAVKG